MAGNLWNGNGFCNLQFYTAAPCMKEIKTTYRMKASITIGLYRYVPSL